MYSALPKGWVLSLSHIFMTLLTVTPAVKGAPAAQTVFIFQRFSAATLKISCVGS